MPVFRELCRVNTCLSVYPSYVEWKSPVLITTLNGKKLKLASFKESLEGILPYIYVRFLHVRHDSCQIPCRPFITSTKPPPLHHIGRSLARENDALQRERDGQGAPAAAARQSINRTKQAGWRPSLPPPLLSGMGQVRGVMNEK